MQSVCGLLSVLIVTCAFLYVCFFYRSSFRWWVKWRVRWRCWCWSSCWRNTIGCPAPETVLARSSIQLNTLTVFIISVSQMHLGIRICLVFNRSTCWCSIVGTLTPRDGHLSNPSWSPSKRFARHTNGNPICGWPKLANENRTFSQASWPYSCMPQHFATSLL